MALLPLVDAAVVLDVHPQTLRGWLKKGCPHERNGIKIMLDTDAVEVWMDETNTDGQVGRKREKPDNFDVEYNKWRARRMKALAIAVEHDNAIAQASLQTGEVLQSHLEKCIQFVLSELTAVPFSETWEPEYFQRFEDWRINLRRWLQTQWFDSLDNPKNLHANPIWVSSQFRKFCDGLAARAGALALLDAPAIERTIAAWCDEFFKAVSTPTQAAEATVAPADTKPEPLPLKG